MFLCCCSPTCCSKSLFPRVASHLLLPDMTPLLATPLHGSPFAIPPHGYSTLLLSCVVVPHVIPLSGSLVTTLTWLPACYSHSWLIFVLCSHAWLPIYCSLVWVLNVPIPRLLVAPLCCYLTSLLSPCLLFPFMVAPSLLVVTPYLCFPGWFSFAPPFFANSLWNYTQ